ncbi:MAG TPA: type IV toxin-antitoxin system AbiEi family antitoxin [Bacteroidales bacterium]|nr:type IV toxin-antitoxin system AbiEi family antitoxin [Bacteroidales bacterium]
MSKYFTLLSFFDTFMENLLYLEMIRNNNYLLSWIEKQQSWGKYVFSLEQVKTDIPDISEHALILALTRLSKKGRVLSVYKGFYLIIPPEYASRGLLPPMLFIDNLMRYVDKPYYVGLLSAAALHGAAHQQPQEFFVITNSKQLTTYKKELKINYITKRNIPKDLLEKRKTESGYVYVSNPELTAIDLIYYQNRIGGINRVTSVLDELAEVIKPERITGELIDSFSVPSIQRLGYILEVVLGQAILADKLYSESQKLKKEFFRQPLKAGEEKTGFQTNDRWKIIINTDIEIDE